MKILKNSTYNDLRLRIQEQGNEIHDLKESKYNLQERLFKAATKRVIIGRKGVGKTFYIKENILPNEIRGRFYIFDLFGEYSGYNKECVITLSEIEALAQESKYQHSDTARHYSGRQKTQVALEHVLKDLIWENRDKTILVDGVEFIMNNLGLKHYKDFLRTLSSQHNDFLVTFQDFKSYHEFGDMGGYSTTEAIIYIESQSSSFQREEYLKGCYFYKGDDDIIWVKEGYR